MEFEKQKTYEVKELPSGPILRQWDKNKNSLLKTYPGLGEIQSLLLLMDEWRSYLVNKCELSENITLLSSEEIFEKGAETWMKKSLFAKLGLSANVTQKTIEEVKQAAIDHIWDENGKPIKTHSGRINPTIRSNKLNLNIKELIMLTIGVLKKKSSLSDYIICVTVNTLKMGGVFNPDSSGPGRIQRRWNTYKKPNSTFQHLYSSLQAIDPG